MSATRKFLGLAAAMLLTGAAAPALANHDGYHRDGGHPHWTPAHGGAFAVDARLAERCGLRAGAINPHRYASYGYERVRDDGIGGALIGGVVGGVLGNRIAGRGDRTLGTVAGAAVGAVAGAAIDRAEDGGRPEPRFSGPDGHDDGYYADGYAGDCEGVLPPGYMLVEVPGQERCVETVTEHEEWVPEDVPVRSRAVPRRAPPRDKRIKLRPVK